MTTVAKDALSPAIARMLKAYERSKHVGVVEMPEFNDLLARLFAYKNGEVAYYDLPRGYSGSIREERDRQWKAMEENRVTVTLLYSYVELGELASDGKSIEVKASEERRDVSLQPVSLTVSDAETWVFVGSESGSMTDCMSSQSWTTTYTFTARHGDSVEVIIT